jgi:hypothetical protein
MKRRKFLHLSAVGAGALALTIAGCSPNATATAPPTALPPTAVPPTAVPSTAVPPSPTLAAVSNAAVATSAPTAAPTAAPTNTAVPVSRLASNIAQATTRFLESLDNARLDKATYDFGDAERFRWHWTTPGGFPRNGLPLTEMTPEQKTAAFALLEASLSPAGHKKAREIMSLQRELGNNPELYFVTVFGEPGSASPWGWRWEGHHLSRHFTVVGDEVAVTPFFHGSWPTQTDAGLRAMAVEEDSALQLINSLQGSARDEAILQTRTLTQHVTWNQARVAPLETAGIPYASLDAGGQQLVDAILNAYLESLPDDVRAQNSERAAQGKNDIRFGWAGSLEKKRPQYYRLQGDKFLLEFDNSRNGGTHVHSVWRDFERDFGYHLV